MKTDETQLSEADLDRALDRLMPPVPSAELRRQVMAIGPGGRNSGRTLPLQRLAAAAVLMLAIGLAALFHAEAPAGNQGTAATGNSAAVEPDTEITAQDIALIDGPAPVAQLERFSIAGLPLE